MADPHHDGDDEEADTLSGLRGILAPCESHKDIGADGVREELGKSCMDDALDHRPASAAANRDMRAGLWKPMVFAG